MFAKVYLEITNVCNLNCSFCVGTTRKKKFLSIAEFMILAEKIKPHTDFLYLHLMGEPLLHPDLEKILNISNELGFKVIITTNGVLLDKTADILLNSPALFKISISLHSFEANMGINKKSYFSSCFDFADKASKNDIVTVFRLWNSGGADSLNGEIMNMLSTRFSGEEWAENTKGIRIRKKLFIEYGVKFDWPMYSRKTTDKITCYGMKDHIGVLCDGSVVPCCMDYDGKLSLGNLFNNTLDEILNSERAVGFNSSLRNNTTPSQMCKTCGYAQSKFL